MPRRSSRSSRRGKRRHGRGYKKGSSKVPRIRTAKRKTRAAYRVKARGLVPRGEALVGGYSRGGILPMHNSAMLTYYNDTNYTLDATDNNNVALWDMRPDSLFDPERTVGGGQPRGFDQWATLYQLYRVKSCTVTFTMTFTPLKATTTTLADTELGLLFYVRGTASIPTTISYKQDYERKQDLIRRVKLSTTETTKVTQKITVYPLDLVRAVSARMDDITGWSGVGGNPSYEAGAVPNVGVILGYEGTSFPDFNLLSEVKMDFDCQFKRPALIAAS